MGTFDKVGGFQQVNARFRVQLRERAQQSPDSLARRADALSAKLSGRRVIDNPLTN
jgi:hypothetical protein